MKRGLLILLCSLLLLIGTAGYAKEISKEIPNMQVSWWSLLFERPNPEQLPVRVHFYWAENR